MGLFGKKAAEPAPAPEPAPAKVPVIKQRYESLKVNLTDKALRVELDTDDAYVQYGELVKKESGYIFLVSGGRIVIAEVTPKSKAYKELEPHVGCRVEGITIKTKTGDYGDYYQVSMKLPVTEIS